MWPHRRQPTRLPRPWDSPGKNTGMGCHYLLQCVKVKSESKVAQLCPTLSDPMDCSPPGSSSPWDFPSKKIGVGCHCLLQNKHIFLKIEKKKSGLGFHWLKQVAWPSSTSQTMGKHSSIWCSERENQKYVINSTNDLNSIYMIFEKWFVGDLIHHILERWSVLLPKIYFSFFS